MNKELSFVVFPICDAGCLLSPSHQNIILLRFSKYLHFRLSY